MGTYVKPVFQYWNAESLNAIEARMSHGTGSCHGGGSSGSGSNIQYYYPTAGNTCVGVSNRTVQFEFESDGATDFYFSTICSVNISIKKKNLGTTDLESHYLSNGELTTVISDCAINNGITRYIVRVECLTGFFTVSFRFQQHLDELWEPNGGVWEPETTTALTNLMILTSMVYQWRKFFSTDMVKNARYIISDNRFLTLLDDFINGTITIGSFVTSLGFSGAAVPKAIATLSTLLGGIATANLFLHFFNFKDMYLEQFDLAGGLFFDEDGNRQYTNGVCITYYITNGTPIMGTESWTDGRIYGVCGMTGGISVYDE